MGFNIYVEKRVFRNNNFALIMSQMIALEVLSQILRKENIRTWTGLTL